MRLLDIVLSHRTEAAKYHDHKEKTAYGAAALYLAATAAWALNTEFWKDQSKVLLGFSAAFLLIAAFLEWKFVGWQFRNREDAARIERACVNVMARIAAGELNAEPGCGVRVLGQNLAHAEADRGRGKPHVGMLCTTKSLPMRWLCGSRLRS